MAHWSIRVPPLILGIGILLFHPSIPAYPKAKFPGVVVFSEIYQGIFFLFSVNLLSCPSIAFFKSSVLNNCQKHAFHEYLETISISIQSLHLPRLSDPLTVTGPVARFARQICSQGYIVAAPSSYHEFTGPEPLAYDGPGTDKGNEWKVAKVNRPSPLFSPHHGRNSTTLSSF